MKGSLKLESFELGAAPSPEAASLEFEEARLAAFESGYSAGWDDAMTAQSEDQATRQAELSRNLQALAFTYHEARAHVLAMIHPLLTAMLNKVLPEAAQNSLPDLLQEELANMADDMADEPILIEVHPGSAALLGQILQHESTPPFRIVEDPTLTEGQVFLRLGVAETQVNLDRAVAQMRATVEAFFQTSQETVAHG